MENKFSKYFFVLIFCATSILAQDFTINVHQTYSLDILGTEMIFAVDLTNNSTQDMGVTIIRRKNDLPNNWSSSLCFDNCFAPHLDSISTSADYGSSPLSAGETREISLHVFPLVEDGGAFITLEFINEKNNSERYSVKIEAATILISVHDNNNGIKDYQLMQNYPNPFNPSTIINYSINPKNSNSEFVSLKVFDVMGRGVATLVNEAQTVGNYSIKFNSKNNPISSGIYFYELRTDNFHQIKKMILEK